jgi:hypothetical protein
VLFTTRADGGQAANNREARIASLITQHHSRRLEEQIRKQQTAQLNLPSANVFSLQRRVAGILPVRLYVPRSGKSYRFVRPLVLEEETKITFQYKSN